MGRFGLRPGRGRVHGLELKRVAGFGVGIALGQARA